MWILTNKRLPKEGDYVLCAFLTGYPKTPWSIVIGYLRCKGDNLSSFNSWQGMDGHGLLTPEYWMSLPDPPANDSMEIDKYELLRMGDGNLRITDGLVKLDIEKTAFPRGSLRISGARLTDEKKQEF